MGAVPSFEAKVNLKTMCLRNLSPSTKVVCRIVHLGVLRGKLNGEIELEKRISVIVTAAFLLTRRLDKVDDVKLRR